jgi:hypothetical protein
VVSRAGGTDYTFDKADPHFRCRLTGKAGVVKAAILVGFLLGAIVAVALPEV